MLSWAILDLGLFLYCKREEESPKVTIHASAGISVPVPSCKNSCPCQAVAVATGWV